MLGTRVPNVKSNPTVLGHRDAPGPRPTEQRVDRKLFLFREHWDELADLAEFHQEVFREMKSTESVSRNDIIENFIKWAEDRYWERVGGAPTSDADRAKKIVLLAELLKKEQAEAEAAKAAADEEAAKKRSNGSR